MGEEFQSLEDISRFYATVNGVLVFPKSLASLNAENNGRYVVLSEYGETRFIRGSLLPPQEELEDVGKFCDSASSASFKEMFPDYKRENIGLHRKVMLLFLNSLRAHEDIRLLTKSIGGDALVHFSVDLPYDSRSGYIPHCRGIPVKLAQ